VKRSIKTQFIISFFVILLPVVAFLTVNNWYAKNIVHDKVSETYKNTLDIFVGETDRNLYAVDDYLNKMATLDSDINLLMSYPYGSDDYVLTKIRIQNIIKRDVLFFGLMNTVFLYHEDDLMLSTSDTGLYGLTQRALQRNITGIIESNNKNFQSKWILWQDDLIPGTDFLVRVRPVPDRVGLYIGAIIRVSDILDLLAIQWDDGGIGSSAIYRRDGLRLAESLANEAPKVPLKDLIIENKPYQTVKNELDGESYMVMNRSSEAVDMTINVVIPESYMLQGLPYFQKATYFMVVGLLLIFALYLFFIRQMIFNPLQLLIAGMKKISLGMLDVRLQTNDTIEFVFLANTFNNMAEQIKTLKIGMYEEQLRAQRMELKQLQAQINPHFYMNSLNIIYNNAVLKDHDSVKKMSLHLADYFRFIMRVNRDAITLDEELKHIDSYIEIQKFRFPNKLSCEIIVPANMMSITLPALSLQPFVENAIIHGFVNRREPFRIVIRGRMVNEESQRYLELVVEDNGIGFPDEIMDQLNGEGWSNPLPHADTSSIGILNVIQRLKLKYGDDACITFKNSTTGGGAVIHIHIPLQTDIEAITSAEGQDRVLLLG
jgi:two-component system sensor histidine kinase YesM